MGVKSLWTLLTPVGRPVMLETVEGNIMAIDSSIWIYQFQATMRDKEGRGLVNAHVLGFLRRISKLLFYGIKPVFVFDGGAPALKRSTLNERKKKKSGAALSHAKLAEKLLAAQMRREALNHAQGAQKSSKGKNKPPAGPVEPDENTVYLEDIDGSMPKTPARKKPATPSSSSKKAKFYDHDPYKLPEVDLEEAVAKATRSVAPDPRLATEAELQAFIEDMRPENFDVNSPAFRELPTEVQYEIIGDLRLKSRQTSYARLQNMLKSSKTPLDFSKQQIQNLRQRNSLTQQLLMTTDSIGSAHISIPVRIASERNKEYVLMKNEGESGGWILGIRDDKGKTKDKPIEIDQESSSKDEIEDEESDADMEEVPVPTPVAADPDLSEYRREEALSAISGRHTEKKLAPLVTKAKHINRKNKSKPLFEHLEEDELVTAAPVQDSDEDDDMLAFAIQESLDQSKTKEKHQERPTLSLRTLLQSPHSPAASSPHIPVSPIPFGMPLGRHAASPEDQFFATPNRLETVLSIANTGPSRTQMHSNTVSSVFGKPTLLPASSQSTLPSSSFGQPTLFTVASQSTPPSSSFGMPKFLTAASQSTSRPISNTEQARKTGISPTAATPHAEAEKSNFDTTMPTQSLPPSPEATTILLSISDSDEDMEEASVAAPIPQDTAPAAIEEHAVGAAAEGPSPSPTSAHDSDDDMEEVPVISSASREFSSVAAEKPSEPVNTSNGRPLPATSPAPTPIREQPLAGPSRLPRTPSPHPHDITHEEPLFTWSRSPSPSGDMFREPESSRPGSPPHESWDAAQEMDPHAEEGEFARFMSQVKGKDLDDVRREIDDEIKVLNQQRKAAMRDSEDITQQMISQIMMMLRLFGIPYITAPMEAEAQCAELVSLGLVDGVITDDSDVFLFGAARVFKNMFNQSKTVECFLLTDLSRELGLDRDTLIRLAYLLGSDYVDGLPGIGPVVAMELLKEFPGKDGLFKFKDWWTKVQSGKDKEEDNKSKFRKQFKKKFRDLYLPADWPHSAVQDAYYHPTVDHSDEPFKWGLPDLDALRGFFQDELGWGKAKVDELLLPIIQRMNKRGQASALNKQGNLNEFFDVSAGSGTSAPKKRQAYTSKRLQDVLSDFRKKQKSTNSTPAPGSRSTSSGEEAEEAEEPPKKRKKTSAASGSKAGRGGAARGRGRGRGGAAGKAARGGKRAASTKQKSKSRAKAKTAEGSGSESEDEYDDDDAFPEGNGVDIEVPLKVELRPRPKPRPVGKAKETQAEKEAEASEPTG